MLLYHGGLDLQAIFYSIPDGDTVAASEDPYDKNKYILTGFKPNVNAAYERHLFRNNAQREDKIVGQFVSRRNIASFRRSIRNCVIRSSRKEAQWK